MWCVVVVVAQFFKVVQDPLLAAAVAASKAGQELGVHILYALLARTQPGMVAFGSFLKTQEKLRQLTL